LRYPVPPSTSKPKSSSGKKSSGSGSSGKKSSGKSSGSKPAASKPAADPYAKARADQLADQKKAEQKAAARLSAQASRLAQQAAALKVALGSTGFPAQLRRDLGNANLVFNESDALVLSQYNRGKTELEKQKGTSEENRARSLQEAGQNAGRERNEALAQGIQHGISATDMLKAQGASLRNWSLNTNQVQSNYTDEVNSLQSEHSQMVNTVVTSRQQAWREREEQRTQLYRGYYDNIGQVYTEIGNKLGESAQYYDMANEQVASKTYQNRAKSANASAMANLRTAAAQTGKGYKQLATPTSITKWQGTANIRNSTDARQWGNQALEIKDAQGASARLRKWEE
jgi:hypothetical protein